MTITATTTTSLADTGVPVLRDRYLLTQVADLTLVFAAASVTEIIRIEKSKILTLPCYSFQVAGVVNHNGQLIPLVSAHSLLQQIPTRNQEIWTVIRLQADDGNIGIIIDRAIGNTTKKQLPTPLFTDRRVDSLVLMTPQLIPSKIWQPQQ
jgi:chemotaxis signal transduction protein